MRFAEWLLRDDERLRYTRTAVLWLLLTPVLLAALAVLAVALLWMLGSGDVM